MRNISQLELATVVSTVGYSPKPQTEIERMTQQLTEFVWARESERRNYESLWFELLWVRDLLSR